MPRLAPPVGRAYLAPTNDNVTIMTCIQGFDNFTQMSIELKDLKTSTVCHLKTICSISFKLTVFIADTHRCLHVNFLSNWLSFNIAENFIKLSKQRCVCVPWIHRNTMHLEFLKIIKFKW